MAQPIYRVQGDTGPDEEFVVTRGKDKTIVDLTDATVAFVIKSQATGTITNTGHQPCTLTDPSNGKCTYTFQTGDLPDAGGEYFCDLRVTSNDKTETYYEVIKIHTRPKTA